MTTNSEAADKEAVQHLKQAVHEGKHWYIALLEAVGLWGSAEETYDGEHYRYLISGEAFDWLSLVERLCLEVNGLFSEEEKLNLLFFSIPPLELSEKEFSHLIGDTKYRAYLNYFYGVIVEEALIPAVEEEVCKERRNLALCQDKRIQEEAYQRVYGTDMATLLSQFRHGKKYPYRKSMTLTEQKEFTYWLFKYRLKHCDKERVASDTKKALEWWQHQRAPRMKGRSAEVPKRRPSQL